MKPLAHNRDAYYALKDWALWVETRHDPEGWPKESSEVRAFQRHQQATKTDGQARYTGTVTLEGGKKVIKLPPPMPKETRPQARSSAPTQAELQQGERTNQMLLDMVAQGQYWTKVAALLADSALYPDEPIRLKARALGLSPPGYYKRRDAGYAWLTCAMRARERA